MICPHLLQFISNNTYPIYIQIKVRFFILWLGFFTCDCITVFIYANWHLKSWQELKMEQQLGQGFQASKYVIFILSYMTCFAAWWHKLNSCFLFFTLKTLFHFHIDSRKEESNYKEWLNLRHYVKYTHTFGQWVSERAEAFYCAAQGWYTECIKLEKYTNPHRKPCFTSLQVCVFVLINIPSFTFHY
jgi:hypothetical protein